MRFLNSLLPSKSQTYSKPDSTSLHASSGEVKHNHALLHLISEAAGIDESMLKQHVTRLTKDLDIKLS